MQVGLVLPQGYFNEFEGWAPGRAWERIVELATVGMKGFQEFMANPDRLDRVLEDLERTRKRVYAN